MCHTVRRWVAHQSLSKSMSTHCSIDAFARRSLLPSPPSLTIIHPELTTLPPAASSGPGRADPLRAACFVPSSTLFPPLKVKENSGSIKEGREEDLELENMARLCGRRREADRVEESQRRGHSRVCRGYWDYNTVGNVCMYACCIRQNHPFFSPLRGRPNV